jgi:hypothetical protein
MVVSRYEALRQELQEVQREFELFSAQYIPLYHDLIWAPGFQDWKERASISFIDRNRQATSARWESWERWPNRAACSRFWGYGEESRDYLPQFKKLADRGYYILGELRHLGKNTNDRFSAALATFAEENSGYYGWLELVSEWGMRFPTTRLQSDNGWWKYTGPVDGVNIERLARMHPCYLSLRLDAFESSVEFINLCLDLDGGIRLGPWDGTPEIVLPEPVPLPEWQADKGELWYQGRLIKKFVKAAPNQRHVLDAFQREQWAYEIRNPFLGLLPGHSVKTAAEQSIRTVGGLNEDHKRKRLLRFGCKSMGDVVYWK